MDRTAHLGVYDTLTDSEVGHLLVELHTGRFTGTRFDVITVAEANQPITTMGGVTIVPDMLLADLDAAQSDVLILPGAETWDVGGGGGVRCGRHALPRCWRAGRGDLRRHRGSCARWPARRAEAHQLCT